MRVPRATYRLQLHGGFGFRDAARILPYLDRLGISHVYLSPVLSARSESSHGYDVTDPDRLNRALGSEKDFRDLSRALERRGMGLLLDIVPNHMAASRENGWWMDVLENGPASRYAPFFDIDWQAEGVPGLRGKVLLPVLGDTLGRVLERGEISVGLEAGGFMVRYHEHRFPLAPSSYPLVLAARPRGSETGGPGLADLAAVIARLAGGVRPPGERWSLKRRLHRLYRERPAVTARVDRALLALNGQPENRSSFDRLERLLGRQHYRLSHWRTGLTEVNYRRFFDINDLVGVRVEDPRVLERRHARLLGLVRRGMVDGLRIDHVDGLLDPEGYLAELRRRLLQASGGAEVLYLVVEKILLGDEPLPESWPVDGTTGYDFLAAVLGLYLDPAGWRALGRGLARLGARVPPAGLERRSAKRQVLHQLFAAEFRRLVRELTGLASRDRHARDLPVQELARVLEEVSVELPVYRTYLRDGPTPRDRALLDDALEAVRRRLPPAAATGDALAFLGRVLKAEAVSAPAVARRAGFRFVLRWQQLTGPLMAKGLEDTASYRLSPLACLGEVGSEAESTARFAEVDRFHDFVRERGGRWPHALNASSTHDTKRSEDVRARIEILAEIPGTWQTVLERWLAWNAPKKPIVAEQPVPDLEEELLLYQTLVGVWPLDPREEDGIRPRVRAYMRKAVREAKRRTSWLQPDEAWEAALDAFVSRILDPAASRRFLADLRRLARRVAPPAALHSAAQVLIKAGAPGVPDFYQGTELLELSLVDPDNRRPVDFSARERRLAELVRRSSPGRSLTSLVRELCSGIVDGRLKLFVTWTALSHRRRQPDLYRSGAYQPLAVRGPRRAQVVSFARTLKEQVAIVAAPRRLGRFGPHPQPGPRYWRGTALLLPPGACRGELVNLLTGRRHRVAGPVLPLSEIYAELPLALLARPPRQRRRYNGK